MPISSRTRFPISCFVCISLVWCRELCFYNIAELQISRPSGISDYRTLAKAASLSIDTFFYLSNGSIAMKFFVFLVGEKSSVWYPTSRVKNVYRGRRGAQLCSGSRLIINVLNVNADRSKRVRKKDWALDLAIWRSVITLTRAILME